MNYVIRAAKPGDLQSIYEMAKLTGGGFTNLPPDKKALRAKLRRNGGERRCRGKALGRAPWRAPPPCACHRCWRRPCTILPVRLGRA